MLVATQAMNVVFVPWLGHAGLALSIGLGALVNAGWLLIGLRRSGVYTPRARLGRASRRASSSASALLGGALAWAAQAHRLDRAAGAVGAARRADGRWCWAAWRCCTSRVLAAGGLRLAALPMRRG